MPVVAGWCCCGSGCCCGNGGCAVVVVDVIDGNDMEEIIYYFNG